MVKQSRAALLPTNLPHLQNLIKRNPGSYKEEFLLQWQHYQSSHAIFLLRPDEEGQHFIDLARFIAQVSNCYPEVTEGFPDQIAHLLFQHHTNLSPDLREKLIQCLLLLRKKGVIAPTKLIETLLPLLAATPSKALRLLIFKTVLATLKDANKEKHIPVSLNRTVQTLLFSFVGNRPLQGISNLSSTSSTPPGVWAVRITSEMWRRGIWSDARSVELMKEAACSDAPRVALGGVQFFLGRDKEDEKGSDSDDDLPDVKRLQHGQQVGKKSKSKERQLAAAKALLKKKERKAQSRPANLNFSAIHLLHDPQAFAEVLYSKHLQKSSSPLSITQKIVVLNLVSRLIAAHKLIVFGLYSWIIKYLTPKQRDVTQFLACAAMASHEFVPPDTLEPIISKIAHEFVTGGVSFEVLQAGLNSIREICARAPLVMDADLLQDLTSYKSSRDKGVVNAARSLITLYREVAPELLLKKDRGKNVSMAMSNGEISGQKLQFGVDRNVTTGIQGLELLEAWKKDQGELTGEEDEGWKEWELGSEEEEDSDGSGGWIEVSSDEEHEIDISDSEPEDDGQKPPPPKSDPTNSVLATSKILTPADLAKLEELRAKAIVDGPAHKAQRKSDKKRKAESTHDEFLDASTILGPRKKAKQDREERMQHAALGREDREKFASKMALRREDGPHTSTTNREKARKKNLMMTIHKIRKGGKAGLAGHGKKFRAMERKRQKGKVKK